MSTRPIKPYHFQADLIWSDRPCKNFKGPIKIGTKKFFICNFKNSALCPNLGLFNHIFNQQHWLYLWKLNKITYEYGVFSPPEVYILVRKLLSPGLFDNDKFFPSRGPLFFWLHRVLFALILPYLALILPFYYLFSLFLSPFFPFPWIFTLFLFLLTFSYPPPPKWLVDIFPWGGGGGRLFSNI
jgi:hypothetical protein